MKKIFVLPSFERSVKKLSIQEKNRIADGLEAFNELLATGKTLSGLGFKKISADKYEFRVDIRLRVIVKASGDEYYLVLAGNHDEVRRYLRNFR